VQDSMAHSRANSALRGARYFRSQSLALVRKPQWARNPDRAAVAAAVSRSGRPLGPPTARPFRDTFESEGMRVTRHRFSSNWARRLAESGSQFAHPLLAFRFRQQLPREQYGFLSRGCTSPAA